MKYTMLFAAAALLASASTAQADAKTDKRERAQSLFRAGSAAYNAGKFVSASQAFEQAYEALPLPAIAFSAAQAYRLQYFVDKDPSKLKRSIELYRGYIKDVKEEGRREDAVASLAELEPIVLRLEEAQRQQGMGPIAAMPKEETSTKIMVTTSVAGAKASLDGGEPSVMPLVLEVKAGRHVVRVTADGYFPFEEERDVIEGQLRVVEVSLKPQPAAVRVKTESGAQISVDGRPVGTTPLARPLELDAGPHFIAVTSRGRESFGREVMVENGESIDLEADLERTTQRSISYYVLGASALTTVGAGVTTFLALSANGDANDLTDKLNSEGLTAVELAELGDAIDRRDDHVRTTWILAGVGGALAVGGGLLYFLDTPGAEVPPAPSRRSPTAEPDEMKPVAVAPVLGPDSVGMVVTGRF